LVSTNGNQKEKKMRTEVKNMTPQPLQAISLAGFNQLKKSGCCGFRSAVKYRRDATIGTLSFAVGFNQRQLKRNEEREKTRFSTVFNIHQRKRQLGLPADIF
jgi:hypothetical protein